MLRMSKENRKEKKGGPEKSPEEEKGKGSRVAQEEKDRGAGRQRQLYRERKATRG